VSSQSGSASGSKPLPPDEYESLIERLRETADSVIPRNATVLVVSRGDDELLHMGARRGLHFPHDEFGRYPGYHPEDSEAAIAILENMRARGGEYLLLPSTSFWWLEYYEGFRDHLESNYSSVVSGDDCMIFELTPTGVQTAASDADTGTMPAATSRRLAGPLDELLRALLPADARIAVVTAGDATLPSFPDSTAVQSPDGAGGAQFLVIPASPDEPPLNGRAEPIAGWKLVTSQRHLGVVYESEFAVGSSQLAGHDANAAAGSPPRDGELRTANRELRTANPGFWRRLKSFFHR
jgi:hypothetical protein